MTVTVKKMAGMILCLGLSSTLTSVALAATPSSTRYLVGVIDQAGFNFRTGVYYLWDKSVAGGVIFANDMSGFTSIVAALADEPDKYNYASRIGSIDGASNNGLFQGIENTNAIIAAYPSGNAAAACNAKNTGDSATYYLPSLAELRLLFTNQLAVAATALANGGGEFASLGDSPDSDDAIYLSSTEAGGLFAWGINFFTGLTVPVPKTTAVHVRCIAKVPIARTYGIFPNLG